MFFMSLPQRIYLPVKLTSIQFFERSRVNEKQSFKSEYHDIKNNSLFLERSSKYSLVQSENTL